MSDDHDHPSIPAIPPNPNDVEMANPNPNHNPEISSAHQYTAGEIMKMINTTNTNADPDTSMEVEDATERTAVERTLQASGGSMASTSASQEIVSA